MEEGKDKLSSWCTELWVRVPSLGSLSGGLSVALSAEFPLGLSIAKKEEKNKSLVTVRLFLGLKKWKIQVLKNWNNYQSWFEEPGYGAS